MLALSNVGYIFCDESAEGASEWSVTCILRCQMHNPLNTPVMFWNDDGFTELSHSGSPKNGRIWAICLSNKLYDIFPALRTLPLGYSLLWEFYPSVPVAALAVFLMKIWVPRKRGWRWCTDESCEEHSIGHSGPLSLEVSASYRRLPCFNLCFYHGLVFQHGKDFEAIQNNIALKYKKKGKPASMVKNKEQVRHFYYRTWHKITKYIDFDNGERSRLSLWGSCRAGLGSGQEQFLKNHRTLSGVILAQPL